MTLDLEIPGRGSFAFEHLLLDVNGTLTDRGKLIEGVQERLEHAGQRLEVHLLSADTFGTLASVATTLRARPHLVLSGEEKRAFLAELGAGSCVAIGNGANDAAMLDAAALGIAVVGAEGAAGSALRAADVVCLSILDALDLIFDETALQATLRS